MRRRDAEEAPPAWLVVGAQVDYSSVIGRPATLFNLVVRAGPERLGGDGEWVVWLAGKAGCVSVLAVAPSPLCSCGRRRCTAADLARWNTECPTGREPDPPWARAICWIKSGLTCNYKPLEAAPEEKTTP